MTESKHTPLPWHVGTHQGHHCIWASAEDLVIAYCGAVDDLTQPESAVDAAFIVRAVNSHDELVAALEQIARLGMEADRKLVDVATMLSEIARAALAKAKGE